ncbi:hypothetical protein I4641_09930 [Waterburya agarophytonicola K14]|uniref:Uncharacterized protein n=1 Tax=Waterburya agarophytonicola KI4 TaxID=2874699 RepID=A0A964BQ82_9CYAN|nr:hypothetical protein [Waterburya agarophytonicola]MCC0177294.1 hypothetical protein [Waterburya agarophytonicola KI4]
MVKKSRTKFISIPNFTVISIVNVAVHSLTIAHALASSDADYNFTTTSDWHDCQQIDSAYQAVYAFETNSFYVNICQKEDAFFYSGEAKTSDLSSIFIPAYPLENGSGFKAKNGNVSYWIILPFGGKNNLNSDLSEPTEAILTIKRNDRLVSVESSLNKYCHQSETALVWDTIELQPHNSNRVATIPRQQDIGWEFFVIQQGDRLLPAEIFNSDSRFDFYRIGGELHRLTTCN